MERLFRLKLSDPASMLLHTPPPRLANYCTMHRVPQKFDSSAFYMQCLPGAQRRERGVIFTRSLGVESDGSAFLALVVLVQSLARASGLKMQGEMSCASYS